MKDARSYLLLSAVCFFFAFTVFVISNNWIILKREKNWHNNSFQPIIEKKQISLFYFHQKKWKTDIQELLWTKNTAQNISHLIDAWLTLLNEEGILPKKIILQSVLISPSQTAYLSFDHNILPKEESIFSKWMLIEGLLKTIANLNEPVKSIQFLAHHQELHDQHLDFSKPWPIHGFSSQ